MCMHRKYYIGKIVRKSSSVESKNCTYHTAPNNGGNNKRNDEYYDLKFRIGKIIIKITIMEKHMNMPCSMNMYTSQILHQYNLDNLDYHFTCDDGFKNEECDFKMYNRKNQYEQNNSNKIL